MPQGRPSSVYLAMIDETRTRESLITLLRLESDPGRARDLDVIVAELLVELGGE